jgi:cobalt-zinc-cadmium efflux system outer membrane protein
MLRAHTFLLVCLALFAGAAMAASPLPAAADLDLATAESLWQRHNREVRLAREGVAAAEADSVAAGQSPNPQFSISTTSINPRTGIGGGSLSQKRVDSVLRLEQLVERGDKRELRQQVAGAMVEAAGRGLADVQRQSLLQLRAAYWELRLAQERQAIAEESAGLFRRSVRAAEHRLKVGDVAGTEVARLRIEAGRAENEARGAQADLERARQSLAYLIGKEQEADGLRASEPWPALEGAVIDNGAPQAPTDVRPDVQAARARVQAAEAARELARAARTRDVAVGVQFEHYPPGNESPNNTYGLSLSVPLFVRHAYEGEIARAEADLLGARIQEEQVRALAQGETAQAASLLRAAVERRRQLESGLLADAKRVATATEFAYVRGALGLLELLDARRTLRAVRLDAAALRADHAKALAAWQAALGH